jgi:hypothetical protein
VSPRFVALAALTSIACSGTTICVTFAEGSATNVVSKKVIDTTTPKETLKLVREECASFALFLSLS